MRDLIYNYKNGKINKILKSKEEGKMQFNSLSIFSIIYSYYIPIYDRPICTIHFPVGIPFVNINFPVSVFIS